MTQKHSFDSLYSALRSRHIGLGHCTNILEHHLFCGDLMTIQLRYHDMGTFIFLNLTPSTTPI